MSRSAPRLRLIATLVLAALLHGATASAQTSAAGTGADLSFDLFGDQPKVDPAAEAARREQQHAFDKKVRLRRRMLTAHQIAGFSTLALLGATLVLGQLNWIHQFGGGDFTERYNTPHLALAATTTVAFATTGALALAAPNPYPKPIRADKALLHKVAMAVATAGMVTQVILGPISASRDGTTLQRNLSIGHLATGYLTFASMALGVFAYVF